MPVTGTSLSIRNGLASCADEAAIPLADEQARRAQGEEHDGPPKVDSTRAQEHPFRGARQGEEDRGQCAKGAQQHDAGRAEEGCGEPPHPAPGSTTGSKL